MRRNSAYCQQNPEDVWMVTEPMLTERGQKKKLKENFIPGTRKNMESLWPTLRFQHPKLYLWFLLWAENHKQRTGWTRCYRRLRRQIPDQKAERAGCVKACGTHRLQTSSKDKLHLPDSYKQAGRKWAVRDSTHCSSGLSLLVPSVL